MARTNTLTVEQKVHQETDMIVAMATRIFDVGALYCPVEPDMYKVQSPDGTDDAVIVSARQFRQILSIAHTLRVL